MKTDSQTPQRKRWIENSLERADEDLSGNFSWNIIKKFGPYLSGYQAWAIVSVILMLAYTVLNLANPFLIGLAIDQFIGQNNLQGLAVIGIVLIVVNILMW